jgi:hypothetical protein
LQFLIDATRRETYRFGANPIIKFVDFEMNPVINFVEYENRVISATYRNLMVRARVVLVDKASGAQLPDPVAVISSPLPSGSLRMRLPDSVKPGTYYLKALNGHGEYAAQSTDFDVG